MNDRRTVVAWLWRVLAVALVLVLAQMLGGPLVMALGLEMPRVPGEISPGLQLALLLPASLAMALAMALIADGLSGPRGQRWLLLAGFVWVVHGLGTALESKIFTTLGGEWAAALLPLLPAVLGSLAAVRLFPAPAGEGFAARLGELFAGWSAGRLVGRVALAVAAFPFVYFLFGMIIAPIVTPHYARLDFLVIPPVSTILGVLFTRSAMFLLVSLPLIVAWGRSRGRLLLALGYGHFAAVGFVGLIQVPFFPAVLRWTHGVEILADSFCYAAVLVWLFHARRQAAVPRPAGAPIARDLPTPGEKGVAT